MISDSFSDFFMLQLNKKVIFMEEIKPLKDFLLMFMTPSFAIGGVLLYIKIRYTEKKEAREKKENFTDNSFSEIKALLIKSDNKIAEIESNQDKKLNKEDADKKFIDKDMFDLHTKNIDKRFDTMEKKAEETKNDLKDFFKSLLNKG
tara:strand:+ start:2737 stop:3177 length:441 start_codon:yes stop_codon:yes gene_type:complete